MIEYITKTGIFGIYWCIITFIILPYLTYKFFKKHKYEGLEKMLPNFGIIAVFIIMGSLAKDIIGTGTGFDAALTLIKDSWFLMGSTIFNMGYFIMDKDLLKR